MRMRKLAASLSIGAVALLGLENAASAAAPGFTVPATTITAGTTLQVTLTDECRNALGQEDYGNLIQGGPISDNQESLNNRWIKGDTGVFRFPLPGTYKLGRWCDGQGYFGSVFITVVAPTEPTTPSTTAAPGTSAPGTSSPATTTPVCQGPGTTTPGGGTIPGCTTTTTVPAGGVTTTTAAVSVEGRTSTRSGATTQATGATPVAGSVSYTG